MSIQLVTTREKVVAALSMVRADWKAKLVTLPSGEVELLLEQALQAHDLHALINNPHTDEFLPAVQLEAAHQRDRWGEAHDRGKSAENWFWLVGYLAGKCLRAVITGDREKALHHTVSSAAALANWYEAIKRDTTGTGFGQDNDIKPVEIARFEGGQSLDTSEREAS
jgi:hypothetical protein